MCSRVLPLCCAAVLLAALGGCTSTTSANASSPAPVVNGAPASAAPQPTAVSQPVEPRSVEPRRAEPRTAEPSPEQSASAPQPVSGPDAMRAIPCTARDVVLKPSRSDDFNGMSHSGTYLTQTNKSRSACSVPGLPQLTFLDANGPVKADANLPGARFMHPGPVVLPIVLQPKQSVTASARWIDGPVFQDNLCYKLTGVTLALREGAAMTPLTGQMCGERSKGVAYDLQRYGSGPKP